MAKAEGTEATERTRAKARELLSNLEPLIAQVDDRTHLEEKVRQQSLLAIALAGVAVKLGQR
jgi:hypothetical protein